MNFVVLCECADIFNYLIEFINIIGDINSIILINKKFFRLTLNNEMYQNYTRLMRSPKIELHVASLKTPQYYFMKACYYGNSLFKNIFINNKIDIHIANEYVFQWSCGNGHLEVTKWLIELSRSKGFALIDIHADDEFAFRKSCSDGHLEVAKWLIELSQCEGFTLIDIHADDEFAFRRSCFDGRL